MKVLVGIKRVVDYTVRVSISADQSGIDLANAKMAMNPFCEIALEEAVRLKENKLAKEIIAISIGPQQCQETLRTALAMGVDRAIHVQSDLRIDKDLQPLGVSKVLAKLAKKEKCDLVILGKQSIDDDCNETGQILAGLLKWPQATFASKLTIKDKYATVVREIDAGLQTVSCKLPAVITCDLRLNAPRYSTLPNIMKARKKAIEAMKASELTSDMEPRIRVLSVEKPPERKAVVMVESVTDLVNKLRSGGVLP